MLTGGKGMLVWEKTAGHQVICKKSHGQVMATARTVQWLHRMPLEPLYSTVQ